MSAPKGTASAPAAIQVRAVHRIYGSTRALADADLDVRPGEIHALLGENGAGKSTLVRVLAGLEQPDRGSVSLFGQDARDLSPADRTAMGIAFIHQDLGLVESMSVADNVALGGPHLTRFGMVRERATRERAAELFDRLGASVGVDRPVAELAPADQAIVAIARAVGVGAKVIVLDEPTARLHAAEVRGLFALLTRLRATGVACLLITHRLDDVLAVCDRVTVMRDGRTVGTRPAAGLDADELVGLIVGAGRPAAPGRRPARVPEQQRRTAAMQVRALSGPGYGPVALDVGRGEVVGLTGLADAGHHEVALSLAGAEPSRSGSVVVDGTQRRLRSRATALRSGIAYLPADRRAEGLAMGLDAAENLYLTGTRPGARRIIRLRAERAAARSELRRFGVRPPEPDRVMDTFSGGNQQKVLLARTLSGSPRVLVLHEPTAAVDVGARADIYRLLRDHCELEACGALVVTSDLDEAARLCDRVLVMRHGRVVADLAGVAADSSTDTATLTAAVTAAAYGSST